MIGLGTITVYKGLDHSFELDLSEFEFDGGTVEFIVEDPAKTQVLKKEYTAKGVYLVEIDSNTTSTLSKDVIYTYYVVWAINGKRKLQALPSDLVVREV